MKLFTIIALALLSLPTFADSLSCIADIGGNTFTPKTKFECSLNAGGAIGYEITVNNSLIWKGDLDKTQSMQTFSTDKKKVGGSFAEYKIFVINNKGERKLAYLKNQTTEENFEFDLTQIIGSCIYDIGGNILTPKTKINCSIFGAGAKSYEIKVNNITKWNGQLDETLEKQDIWATQNKVGGHAVDYQVFIIEKDGSRTLISEQVSEFRKQQQEQQQIQKPNQELQY